MRKSLKDTLILAGAGVIANLTERLLKKILPAVKSAELRTHFKNDIYQLKRKRLHDDAFYHYFDLAVMRPADLAYDLASRDLNELERKKRIEAVYEQKFLKIAQKKV